jgi:hypothetical protein
MLERSTGVDLIGLDRPALSSGSRRKVATIPLVIFGSCPQEYTRAPGVVFHHNLKGSSERGSSREGKQARGETGERYSSRLLARMTGFKSQHICLSGALHSSLGRKKPRDVYVYKNHIGCKVAWKGRIPYCHVAEQVCCQALPNELDTQEAIRYRNPLNHFDTQQPADRCRNVHTC